MSRRALPFVLLAVLLAAPASADAAKSQKKAIWGPVEIDGASQFRVYKDLGVGVFQMRLQWDEAATVAPENGKDPGDLAYDWPPDVETAVAEGRRHGIQVALTVTGTPGWANGERATTVAPTRPADLADFLTAAAKHFKSVHLWAIADGPVTPASRYPQMLDRAYVALHKVSAKNKVIGGNGNKRLKLSGGKAARMDYLGYDPSAKRKLTKSRLASIEKTAGTHKLWLGPTKLYTSVNGPFRMSKSAQASWLTSAFKLISSDAKVAALSYDGLFDEDGGVAHHGLIDPEGRKKPAYTAFKRAS